jgi:putative flippase GtrA
MEIIIMPVITAIVYAVIEIIKTASQESQKLKRFIPLLACVLGVISALVAFFCVPEALPTNNMVIACVIGGASGLASTGLYENVKNIFVKAGEVW